MGIGMEQSDTRAHIVREGGLLPIEEVIDAGYRAAKVHLALADSGTDRAHNIYWARVHYSASEYLKGD